MYFFLLNLSLLDLGSISTTLPKAMANLLWDTRAISYQSCASQVFFFFLLISAEFYLLTVMAYDRYVDICQPLHYGTLLGSRACVHMAAAAWGGGFLNAPLHTANTFSLPLCHGNVVDQFFCEIPQILKLSCSGMYFREAGLIVISVCVALGCFVFIVLSYVQIFRAVLRIPSEQGQHKAFSTSLPHLAVVSLLVSTGLFAYLKPPSISSPTLDLVLSVLYSVVPPAMNPLIYSMRNQQLKDAVRKLMTRFFFRSNILPIFFSLSLLVQDSSRAEDSVTQSLPYLEDDQVTLREAAVRFLALLQRPKRTATVFQPQPGQKTQGKRRRKKSRSKRMNRRKNRRMTMTEPEEEEEEEEQREG
ncbi:olfactory receptor 14C36-like [Tyto alba]|uniref:olfactory receptor 14C36-like n=1 Tax=Tyto alba TaxID=56313 RepID=UPI001C66AAD1|nr:olfactory receptor 14C36-like [Tyto alba]